MARASESPVGYLPPGPAPQDAGERARDARLAAAQPAITPSYLPSPYVPGPDPFEADQAPYVPPPVQIDPFQQTLQSWAQIPPAPYQPPPATVPLDTLYGPLARAYQRGGSQENALGDMDIENPEYVRARAEMSSAPSWSRPEGQRVITAEDRRNRTLRGGVNYGPMGDPIPGEVYLPNAQATSILKQITDVPLRALASGQSALDLTTVMADHVIPDIAAKIGAGDIGARGSQGTVSGRYGQYLEQGLPPDQAAAGAMRDYGDALQKLAEDPSAAGLARGGAQFARVLGLIQSVVSPAPVPGGASLPFAAGILGKGFGKGLVGRAGAATGDFAASAKSAVTRGPVPESLQTQSLREAGDLLGTTPEEAARRLIPPSSNLERMIAEGGDFSRVGAAERAASEAANPSVIGRARGASPHLPTTEIGYTQSATKTQRADAEKRILEMQRQRAITGGEPVVPEDISKATYGGGGNEPYLGRQIEKYPEELQGTMRELADRAAATGQLVTGKITHAQTAQAAEMIGEPVAKVAARLAKRGVDSAEFEMVQVAVAQNVTAARTLVAKAATGTASPEDKYKALAALQEASALQGQLFEGGSEAARILSLMRKQIDTVLASDPSELAYMAAISRIARSPEHAQVIFDGLMKIGDDPAAVYGLLRSLNKPTFWDTAMSLWNLPRAFKATGDLPPVFRQGAILSGANPKRGAHAFAEGMRALRSESVSDAMDTVIRTSPMQPIREKARLYIAEMGPTARLTEREEAMLTTFADRIPVLRMSNRSFVTSMNVLRTGRFDDAILSWQKAGIAVTDERARLLAQWVNIATGRGLFPTSWSPALPFFNGVFFAPRYAISRFEAVGFPVYALAKGDREVAALAAKDLVGFVAANMSLLTLAKVAGAQVEIDPRSPEFGKMKFDNTVIDTWGGEQQVMRNVAQLITGERKTVTGKSRGDVVPVARNEVAGRFLQSKFSPTTGTAWGAGELVSDSDRKSAAGQPPWEQPVGKDFVGKTFSAKDLVADPKRSLLVPLSWADIWQAVEDDRSQGGSGLRGLLLGSVSLLGAGETTYERDERTGTPKSRSGPYHLAEE